MSALVVDTSAWIRYFKVLENDILSEALREGRVFLPPLVVSELLSAKLTPTDQKKMIAFLKDLAPCACALDHWVRVGELRRDLSKAGVHVSTPDAHIAQCALDLDADLMTEDKIFGLIRKNKRLKVLQG